MSFEGIFGAGHFEKRFGVVQVLNQVVVTSSPACVTPGHLTINGIFKRFVVHPTFVVPTVVADVEALVGRVDHDGMFVRETSSSSKVVMSVPDTFIDAPHATQVVFCISLVFPAHERVGAADSASMERGFVPRFVGRRRQAFESVPASSASCFARPSGRKRPLKCIAIEVGCEIDKKVKVQMHVTIDLQLLVASRRSVVMPLVEQRVGLRQISMSA